MLRKHTFNYKIFYVIHKQNKQYSYPFLLSPSLSPSPALSPLVTRSRISFASHIPFDSIIMPAARSCHCYCVLHTSPGVYAIVSFSLHLHSSENFVAKIIFSVLVWCRTERARERMKRRIYIKKTFCMPTWRRWIRCVQLFWFPNCLRVKCECVKDPRTAKIALTFYVSFLCFLHCCIVFSQP